MTETTTTKAKNHLHACIQEAYVLECAGCPTASFVQYKKNGDAKWLADKAGAIGWTAEITEGGEHTYCPPCSMARVEIRVLRNTWKEHGHEPKHTSLCATNMGGDCNCG